MQSTYVFAIEKEGDRYVFLCDNESFDEFLQTIGRYAANPELSFTWYEAAILSQAARRQMKAQISSPQNRISEITS